MGRLYTVSKEDLPIPDVLANKHAPETTTQPNVIAAEKPINCQRAAEFLAVHPRTIKRMAAAGELPGHFRFGRWYFYVSELDSWMRTELNSVSHP
jgi:excisionase family DNA binding protein